jgi:hypothetical protein
MLPCTRHVHYRLQWDATGRNRRPIYRVVQSKAPDRFMSYHAGPPTPVLATQQRDLPRYSKGWQGVSWNVVHAGPIVVLVQPCPIGRSVQKKIHPLICWCRQSRLAQARLNNATQLLYLAIKKNHWTAHELSNLSSSSL